MRQRERVLTEAEKRVMLNTATWCIGRIRQEAHAKRPDYETAADDVCNKLAFFLDWIRDMPRPPSNNAA